MVDILGLGDVPIPSFGIGTGRIALFFAIFIITLAGGIVIWVVYQWRIYKYKIIVFENISGQGYQPTIRDRARHVKVGDGGEEILFLRKTGLYRGAYGRKMGKNTYWYAIGQDGYWYNIVLGDVDTKMGMLDIEPIDRDARLMHVAIRKNIQDRYRKQNFMEKYGQIVISGLFLIIILVGMWFLLDKIAGIGSALIDAVKVAKETQEVTKQLVGALDSVCSGSGLG